VRVEGLWVGLAATVFAATVFSTQNRVVGWEPGYNALQPGHHGWVSSHALAIIAHASPRNGFVGHALAVVDDQGDPDYVYFDRYPVFFSAGMHALISLTPRLSSKIYLAKQAMNLIFVLTACAAFLLLRKVTGKTLPALAATILAFSSGYLLFYKDMIHFDQPALLGMIVLLYTIALCALDGRRRAVYAGTLFAVSLGRGYASLVVLLVWWLLEAAGALRRPETSVRRRLLNLPALVSFRCLAMGCAWAALNPSYNLAIESARRGVSILETSIIASLLKRLALNPEFNVSNEGVLEWGFFLTDQVTRAVRWSFPVWDYEGAPALSAVIIALMLVIIVRYGRSTGAAQRMVLATAAASGVVWLIGMRNMSAFHDYTAMFYLGLALAFYAALASSLRMPRTAWLLVVALSLALFAQGNLRTRALHEEIGNVYSPFTHDFMNIAAALPENGQWIHLAQSVPYAPYAPGFYLPGHLLAPREVAQYIITPHRWYPSPNLTPDNSRLYLFARVP
jgi:hypothetical protein